MKYSLSEKASKDFNSEISNFTLPPEIPILSPPNVPHAICQLQRGKYLYFFAPSGTMEDFMRAVGELKIEGQASPEMMEKLFEAHDMNIVERPLKF